VTGAISKNEKMLLFFLHKSAFIVFGVSLLQCLCSAVQLCKLSGKMSCDFFTLILVKWALLIWQMTIKRDWNGSHTYVRRLFLRGLRERSLISKYAGAHIRSAWAVRLMYGAWTRECWAETWCLVNANIPRRP